MTNAIVSEEEGLMWISGFGPVPHDKLDLANKEHELRVYALSDASTKTLTETLAFAAQFSSDEVYTAYMDIMGDEAYVTFEIKGNTRPQTLSLRYMADRWSAVESHGANSTSARKTGAPTKPSVKTIYHAFLDAALLSKVGGELRVALDESTLVRINFKEKTYSLVMHSDKADALPNESIQSLTIPRVESTTGATMTPSEQSRIKPSDDESSDSLTKQDAEPEESFQPTKDETKTEAAPADQSAGEESPTVKQALTKSDPEQEVTADFTPDLIDTAVGFADAGTATTPKEPLTAKDSDTQQEGRESKTFQNHPGKDSPQKIGRLNSEKVSFEPPKQSSSSTVAGSAKYDTYSKSEVERLIKKSAENVTTTVTSKMNAHQKSLKEGLNNHEFAVKQSVEKLKQQLEDATSRLNKATSELNSKSTDQSDQFKTSLKKEMEDFKGQMNKNMSPTIKALEAKLDQLNEAKKKLDSAAPANNSPSRGLLIGVMLAVGLAIINLLVGYFAFERISALEAENAKLMSKTSTPAATDVPVPDLMKEQLDKEAAKP